MDAFGLLEATSVQKYVFNGNSVTAGRSWHTWNKPIGKSMAMIIAIGAGGGGGTGVVAANSLAGGGGGGGSGGQTIVTMPLDLLPSRLYISVGLAKTGAGIASYVTTQPNIATANGTVVIANGGGVGGNAVAGAGGGAGGAGAIATNATMPLGWPFSQLALAGQAGIIGGAAVSGAALAYPTTGLRVTGGTGGGGLPAAAAAGTSGGAITGIASPSYFQGVAGGAGSATATVPADFGISGTQLPEAGMYFRGGTGAASTHGTAITTGLVQGRGGDGDIGCGGGGNGGALTGSSAATQSLGGAGLVMIYCY